MATNSFPLDGSAGIGTANPNPFLGLLQLQLSAQEAAAGLAVLSAGVGVNDAVPATLYARPNGANGYTWYLTRSGQDDQGLSIDATGNVAVAKNLAVGGALKIKTWEISVPDYVFREGYPLPPLSAVAEHVRAHGHLPEVPSAAEIGEGGLDAGGMILLLLRKIEELTLHALAHEERLSALDRRLSALEAPAAAR